MPKVKSGFTSIIMNTYIQSPMVAHMTMASLAALRKFTDLSYELIVVDNEPRFAIRDEYQVLKIDKYIKNDKDIGCYASYNLGVRKARGDVLVFIQNDVFVPEGWLSGMRYYIDEHLADVVFPDQCPRSREYVLESHNLPFNHPGAMKGSRDAGLMMISRVGFDRTGGWPEGAKSAILSEKFMYERIGNAGLTWTDTRKVIITHIMAATNLIRLHEDRDEYNRLTTEEEKING